MIQRLRKLSLRLRWQLTLRYMLVTVTAFVMVMVLAAVGVWYVLANSNLVTIALISITKSFIAPSVVSYLDDTQPNIRGLGEWMQEATTPEGLSFQSPVYTNVRITMGGSGLDMILLVLDSHLEFLAGVPELSEEPFNRLFDESEEVLAAALAGEENPERISYISNDQSLTLAVPAIGEKGDHLGVVVLRMANPSMFFFRQTLSFFGSSIFVFTIAIGIIGAVFGFFTARGLTNRFQHVTQATDHWSQGDFSTFIQDSSEDELGQLAQRLNRMAEQLQNLLHTRQKLAALEERNRLARDLHDGVKQQVFATAMQLGTARALIEQDAKAAEKHLDEAEQLARQAQTELTAIIRELYPATLESKGLAPAIEEQIDDWSRLNKISVKVRISDDCSLAKEVEQTIFRVTQEALSNIAKHSQATHVEVELACDQNEVSITISDNGKGFDVDTVEGKGVGLRSMRERVEALGGDFMVESNPGHGSRLIARCQINKGESS
ncbi:MAG: sensor histidine kinase [Anaerolineales bacterium]